MPPWLVSAVISAAGNIGSVTGMQLLMFAVLGTGPLGAMGPWWSVLGLFLAGAAWGTGLSMLGWVFFPMRRSSTALPRRTG
ncbi:hypothetical protein [Dactylosporangium cerinum]